MSFFMFFAPEKTSRSAVAAKNQMRRAKIISFPLQCVERSIDINGSSAG
jgi:hypothetical protein